MKHLTILIALMVSFALNETVLGQRDDRYQAVNSYSFDNAVMYINNEFASDTASGFIPEYFQPPYKDRRILVYGPSLDLKMMSVRGAEGFSELRKVNIKSFSGNVVDTTVRKQPLFDMRWLQVRLERNGKLLLDWQNVRELRNIRPPAPQADKPHFLLFSDTINTGERLKLSFRNTSLGDTLINFIFERPATPLQPFLAISVHDSSTRTTRAMFIQKQMQKRKAEMDRINTFYKYWPDSYGGAFKNDRYFPASKLALYYRKPSNDYPDNSLEYAMLVGKAMDTSWTASGHLLILPQLESGKRYRLLVRYRENPSFIKVNTFYTSPAWYQSAGFYWILASSLAILVLTFFLFRYRIGLRTEKKKGRALQANLQSIRAQLNPHFIFNALSSIQSLINNKDIDGANHYLSAFSDLLRQSLRNSDKEMIPLQQELQLLETYLSLEQLRFSFTYALQLDDSINSSSVEIPSLLLQPVIENAIKHAAGPLGEKGRIGISLRAVQHDLLISVTDNGPGFDTNTVQGEGHGMRLTTERILILNQLINPRHIHLEAKSTKSGTVVHLNFRNWLQV